VQSLTISAHGGLDQLVLRDDIPVPELAAADDVQVRIEAAALNHLDLFVVEGLPGVTIVPPWIVGTDGCGVVESCGSAVTHVRQGDRVLINPGISDGSCDYCRAGEDPLCLRFGVMGEHRPGTVTDYVVVPARNVRPLPPGVGAEEGAAFTLATLTAWRMVVTRAAVQPGELVLIQGIGGGVALAALAICRAIGARAWVTSTSDDKLARARTLGAEEGFNSRQVDVARAVRQRTGKRGVDVVLDNVGTATWAQSLGALGRRGRLVTCGGTSGPMVETDIRRLFWNQWTIMGSTMGSEAEFDAISRRLAAGELRPVVDSVYPIAEGRRAFERLASGEQFGKVVIRVA
jgi:NADPH:quinone reductase-like Zn-dependent oxidoreductase